MVKYQLALFDPGLNEGVAAVAHFPQAGATNRWAIVIDPDPALFEF